MQKWEYLSLPIVIQNEMILSKDLFSYFQSGILILNTVGQDGWELVSVDGGIAYFKRPLKAEAAITDLAKCFDPREGENLGPYPHVSKGVYGD